ncbi:MAG: hypothetical protein KGY99_02755 [Phycisphaerae bacterium]|nr:hypothetical protein [Phycisphaerae bacterium]
MKRHACIALMLTLATLSLPAPGRTPMADHLPKDTLVYYAWAGRTDAFATSPLGKLAEGDKVAEMLDVLRETMLRGAPGESGRTMVNHGWEMASILWQRPCAAALTDLALDEDGGDPIPAATMVVDLGEHKAAFAEHLDAIVEAARAEGAEFQELESYTRLPIEDKFALSFGFDENVLFVCFGQANLPETLLAVKAEDSLATNAAFTAAMKDVAGDAAQLSTYINVTQLKDVMEAVVQREAPPADDDTDGAPSMVSRIVRAFGVQKATAMASATQFVDGSLYTRTRLMSPPPHSGVLRLAAERPITADDLAALPADADYVAVSSIAPQSILEEIRRGLGTANERMAAQLDRALENVKRQTGVSLEDELLAGLGQTWTACMAESQGGFVTGTAIWTPVRDREKLTEALGKLEKALAGAAAPAGEMPARCPRCGFEELSKQGDGWACPRCGMTRQRWQQRRRRRHRVEVKSMTVGDTAIHYVSAGVSGMPLPVAPAWAIHEDRFYLAPWPQVIQSIIEAGPDSQGKHRAPRLAETEAFVRIRSRLADNPSVLIYANTPALMRRVYPVLLVGGTMGVNALASHTPLQTDMSWLPSLQKLQRFMGPTMVAISADDKGLLYEEYASMPGRGILAAPLALFGAGEWLTCSRQIAPANVQLAQPPTADAETVIYAETPVLLDAETEPAEPEAPQAPQ